MTHRLVIVSVLALTLACATSQPYSQYASQLPPIPEGMGRVFFYRGHGFLWGYGMRTDIYMDGETVGRSVPRTVFHVDTTPGNHLVATEVVLYGGVVEDAHVEVLAGEAVFVETWVPFGAVGGLISINPVSRAKGERDVQSLKLLSASR
jgi:hypothetical protein